MEFYYWSQNTVTGANTSGNVEITFYNDASFGTGSESDNYGGTWSQNGYNVSWTIIMEQNIMALFRPTGPSMSGDITPYSGSPYNYGYWDTY